MHPRRPPPTDRALDDASKKVTTLARHRRPSKGGQGFHPRIAGRKEAAISSGRSWRGWRPCQATRTQPPSTLGRRPLPTGTAAGTHADEEPVGAVSSGAVHEGPAGHQEPVEQGMPGPVHRVGSRSSTGRRRGAAGRARHGQPGGTPAPVAASHRDAGRRPRRAQERSSVGGGAPRWPTAVWLPGGPGSVTPPPPPSCRSRRRRPPQWNRPGRHRALDRRPTIARPQDQARRGRIRPLRQGEDGSGWQRPGSGCATAARILAASHASIGQRLLRGQKITI
jgi:hypothetical protein